ncbi:hypothetical protein [Dyadobacter crusticola]|uniref:hypothetical protein n=1 Tax=Dyadobacter crusticola TaxID=292407 RepID=UPI0004E1BC28|nr:hypothetical protein [Dyadobacter crusticola]
MTELPDDELDKLFRKSSEEFDPQYDPEDWNSLRRKLDQQDGRTGGAWFKKWWPIGLLLLLIPAGIVGYLWRENATQSDRAANEKVLPGNAKSGFSKEQETPAVGDNGKLTDTESDKTNNTEAENANAATVKAIPNSPETGNATELKKNENRVATGNTEKTFSKPLSRSELKAADVKSSPLLPRSRSKAGGVYLEPNRSKTEGGDGALILNADENARRNNPNGTSASELGARQATGSSGVKSSAARSAISESTTKERAGEYATEQTRFGDEADGFQYNVMSLPNKPVNWQNQIAYPNIGVPATELVKSDTEVEADKKKEEVAQAKWAVRFGYSPDLSTVGGEKLTKPGTAVSLLAELSILPRLFVQSGAVWSRKDYRANGGDYILDPRWGYYTKPESIEGVCKVLEIPLNLRYDIVSGSKSRIFAGSGLSSYYMRGEKYKYNYKNPYDPHIKYKDWQGKTGWYLFSHLNASAGYEYRVSDKLSLVAEPYARMPLKRVGYGKVNLFTAGFWISVRYVPAFR